jgi:hypothetical protein
MYPRSRAPIALLAGVLIWTVGCDKSGTQPAPSDAITPAGAPALDLAARPQLLFQLYGDRDDLRLAPLVAVQNGTMKPIGLTRRGWKLLDSLYFAPGTKYPVYHDDVEAGEVLITRGMWTGGQGSPSPSAGCQSPRPLAAVKLTLRQPRAEPYVEMVASTTPLAAHPRFQGKLLTEAEVTKIGRAFGHEVGKKAGLDTAELDSLDFHARLLITGAAAEPTLLVSFIDPSSGNLGPGAGRTMHVFALGEPTGGSYTPSYRHAVTGSARTVEFQRIVDHLDVNGDGVDELIVEAWRYGADNDLVVLAFKDGEWRETLRVNQGWCLDPVKSKK